MSVDPKRRCIEHRCDERLELHASVRLHVGEVTWKWKPSE